LRVLEANATEPIRSPKAYLYVVSRNLVLMRLRRQHAHRTDSLEEIDAGSITDGSTDIPEEVARHQELEMLSHAIQMLPARCVSQRGQCRSVSWAVNEPT
jgi:DNA-directed RNA polymerase specialized sigma24 family protein